MNHVRKILFRAMLFALLPLGTRAQALQMSDAEQEYWYRICSASVDANGLAITDNMGNNAASPLTLEPVSDSDAQLWKLMSEGAGVVFVNCATGHILQPASTASDLYNLTQLQTTLVPDRSFALVDLGESQIAISGEELDGTVRYLVAQNKEQAYTSAQEALPNTAFAWTFTLARHTLTAIKAAATAAPCIKVNRGRVSIEPAVPYCVYTADGALVDATRALVPGVYVIATAGYKVRILVK